MENYTFRQLREALNELSEEQLDMTASIYDATMQEVLSIEECSLASELSAEDQDEIDGVVVPEQPLLIIHT